MRDSLPCFGQRSSASAQTGKTTLFQLMTSAREAARARTARAKPSIGISKVPDERLDRLTAMYNPKKRVPATVEFSDLAAPGRAGGAQALVDVAAYKNADALVHVLRAFDDPAVPHPSGSIDPGARRAGDGRRADPRRPRRRRAPARAPRERSQERRSPPSSSANATSSRCAARRSKTGGRCARSTCRATI